MATATTPMTTAELLALPDDGVDRWLIHGELRERPMSYRNRYHSKAMAKISQQLCNWLDGRPKPPGEVLTGDAGVRLPGEPETTFGIDVVYITADLAARQSGHTTIIEGVPTLAVEILSPSDTQDDINEKIDSLLGAGVPLVWIVDPRRRAVTVHRPDARSSYFTDDQELTAEPHLGGFRVAVADLFE